MLFTCEIHIIVRMTIVFGPWRKRRPHGPALGVERVPRLSETAVDAPPLYPLLTLDFSEPLRPDEKANFLQGIQVTEDVDTVPGELFDPPPT
jgi:hypothetical protein